MTYLLFCLYQWLGSRHLNTRKPGKVAGCFWSIIAGFTSFGIHAGGPPLSIYMLPLGLDKQKLAGTMAIFFGIINLAKLFAYAQMGELNNDNLLTSAVLLPLCPISVFLGMYIVKKINQQTFYKILYAGLLITGIKLIFSGF
ncbi:sulfite exporter TauE/SafE family protein [Endozoicomonas sp. Mp262]|uniref:sulfite exporter TauE/SafE family protein n=1 Tax=Endozoicomonas sp. Mp262 TaxID=2919499 RepID=UPI0021D98F77